MSTVCVQIKQEQSNTPRFQAIAGSRHSFGRTMGEALDALMSEWEVPVQQAEVVVEEAETVNFVEPHLVNEGGFWVIAGGEFSPEDAKRDFVAEMRDERIRSFFPATLQGETVE